MKKPKKSKWPLKLIHSFVNAIPKKNATSSRAGNGNPLQYSWLENSTDRGVSWSIVNGVAKSGT